MIGLAVVAVLYGLVIAFFHQRFTDRAAVGHTVNRMLAHVMSFRLFADEPSLVFRAQRDLVIENLRLLRLLAIPILASGILLAISWSLLDRTFGYGPIPAGESAVITRSLGDSLSPSPEIIIETPPVRIPRLHQTSWRVRVIQPTSLVTMPTRILRLSWFVWFLAIATVTALAAPLRR